MRKNQFYQMPGSDKVVLYTAQGKLVVVDPDAKAADDSEEGVDDGADDEGEE